MLDSSIQIIRKPESVSWEAIRNCLLESHAANRGKGVVMSHYQWSPEDIKDYIGNDGVMLVAMEGEKLVGTAAISIKQSNSWYTRGQRYAYLCFAGILPGYNGKGIYKALTEKRQEIVKELELGIMLFDTHENNKHVQKIAVKNGFRYVHFFQSGSKDHCNVVLVKWIDGCPFSKLYCSMKFFSSRFKTKLRILLKK